MKPRVVYGLLVNYVQVVMAPQVELVVPYELSTELCADVHVGSTSGGVRDS